LGYLTYFETEAFLQLQAPANLPPLDLMIVEDGTLDRIENTSHEKMLDGEQIRIPDVLRLVALKLHATREPTRRTNETDWQDVVALVLITNQNVKILNCRRLFLSMADLKPLPKSENDSATAERLEMLNLPSPREPLLEWTQQHFDPALMVAAIEAVMEVARLQPNFEAQRLARKTAARFKY
jgi:hypothetical protein